LLAQKLWRLMAVTVLAAMRIYAKDVKVDFVKFKN
jgi:hypothetical protein